MWLINMLLMFFFFESLISGTLFFTCFYSFKYCKIDCFAVVLIIYYSICGSLVPVWSRVRMCQLSMFVMSIAYVCSVYSLCFVACYSCGACASQLLLFCFTIVSIVLHRCGHEKTTCMDMKNMLCKDKAEGYKSEERTNVIPYQ